MKVYLWNNPEMTAAALVVAENIGDARRKFAAHCAAVGIPELERRNWCNIVMCAPSVDMDGAVNFLNYTRPGKPNAETHITT